MFQRYLNKVLAILKRQLSDSEIGVVQSKFESGWHYSAAAEYLK